MGEEPSTSGTAVTGTSDPEQIRQEIEETRQQLGDTVEALSAKTDVKAQAKRKLEETKEHLQGRVQDTKAKVSEITPETAASAASEAGQRARQNPLPVATIGAFLTGFVLGRLTRR